MFLHGIFLSQSLLTSQSLRAAIGPLQFSLRHWNLTNLTLHSGMLPYKHASRSLEIFSANIVLSHGSIMLPPHQPCAFARLARWQLCEKFLAARFKTVDGFRLERRIEGKPFHKTAPL